MVSLFVLSALQAGVAIKASIIDFQTYRLPNRLNLIIALLGVAALVIRGYDTAFLLSLFLLVALHVFPQLLGKRWIGMGDSKLMLGLGLGAPSTAALLLWLWLAYFSAAVIGLGVKKLKFSEKIAFGPYLTAAWIIVVMGDYARVAMAYSR